MICAICGKYPNKKKNPVVMTIPGETPLDICSNCLPSEREKDRYEDDMTGYVRVKKNGNWISEHKYIWELHNGPLPRGWLIHHLNSIKNDNRNENLLGMPKKYHVTGRSNIKYQSLEPENE